MRALIARSVVALAAAAVLVITAGPAAADGKRDKSCGSFAVSGLMTRVHVKITDGDFPCKIARRVIEDLFHGRDTGHWNCVGPQTGYARCDKHNRGTVIGRVLACLVLVFRLQVRGTK